MHTLCERAGEYWEAQPACSKRRRLVMNGSGRRMEEWISTVPPLAAYDSLARTCFLPC